MGELLNFAVYNPAMLSDQDFLAGFVARSDLSERLLARLRETSTARLAKHYLILGQRGMGKTSLLRRLALGVRADPELSATVLPLTFREEQYNIHNLHILWCNCLDALGDWFEKSGQVDKAAEIDRDVAALARGDRDPEGQSALEVFTRWTRRENKRAVLLLDNVDLILDGIARYQWSLRRALQSPGGMIVVGASANYMEATSDKEAAFYDFFQVVVLEKLGENELLACLRRLADVRGEEGRQVLRAIDADPGRIRTLYDLTGGNPRTLILLYMLLELDADGDVLTDLERLLDQATVLYKARVEDLAPQARVVLDAVALSWDPGTAADLAKATSLETSAVSAQLDRLQKDGIIEKATLSSTPRAAFQLSERFFNIWYLMRHGPRRLRNRLRWLTGFLREFYSPKQLTDRARDLLTQRYEHGVERGHYCLALSDALEDTGWRHLLVREARMEVERYAATSGLRLEDVVDPSELPVPITSEDWRIQGKLLRDYLNRYEEAEAAYRRAIELDPNYARPWNGLGNLLQDHLNRYEEAEAAYRRAIELDPNYARPWNGLGILLQDHLNRYEEAEAAYRRAIELDPKSAWAWYGLGNLLQYCLDRYEEAEAAYRRAIELEPNARPWHGLGNLLQYCLNRYEEAEAAYRRAIELEPNARPWHGLGNLLKDRLNRYEEAEAAYRRAIELDPKSAWPWHGAGNLLQHCLNRYEEAEAAYRRAIELDPNYALPWNGLGNLLKDRLNRYEEAEAAYRRAIKLNPNYASPWNGLGNLLQDHLNRYEEAEAAYRRAIELDPNYALPWNGLGNLLQDRLNRYEEAEAAYRRAIELDPKSAWPWNNLGNLLQYRLNRYQEAETTYRRAIELDPKSAWPWNNLGNLLQYRLNRSQEAEAAYRRAIELDPNNASLWNNLGKLLQNYLNRNDEAEVAYRLAIEHDPKNADYRCNLGYILLYFLDKQDEAESAYMEALSLKPGDLVAQSNLLALHLLQPSLRSETEVEFESIVPRHSSQGADMLRALRALSAENFGEAAESFGNALARGHGDIFAVYQGFVLLLLHLVAARGYGDKLLNWLDEKGITDRYWPLRVAFDAYLHGKAKLMDVNPEVRGAASRIYEWLASAPSKKADDQLKSTPTKRSGGKPRE
jgi:tetratricopeptide (TPR) repeat protein